MSFLPYPPATTTAAIEVFRQDVALTHEVVHGTDTATVLTENGEIPSLAKALKSITDRVDIANELVEDIEDLKQQAAADIGNAALSAATASAASATAQSAATTASSAANFKGNWVSLTGAYNVPSVVYHKSLYWQLITNTTNITADEPSVSNKWVLADAYSQQKFIEQINKKFTTRLIFDKNQHFQYGKYGLESKLITDVLTTVRTSSATYNTPSIIATALSNEPRIEYDSSTGECLGLLAEESVANLATNSELITSSTGTTLISSNTVIAPDGTLTADILGETTDNSEHFAGDRSVNLTAGQIYTWSVFVKRISGSSRRAYLRVASNALRTLSFNIDSGSDFQNATGGMQSYPNGWKRVWIVTPAATTTGPAICRLQFSDSGANTVYVGDTNEQLSFWGAQLELGSSPTSYIPTTTSAVTRLGDNYRFAVNPLTEFTIFLHYNARRNDTTVIGGVGNTFDNCIYLATNTWSVRVGGASVASIPISVVSGDNKVAISVKSGAIVAVTNGVQSGTNASTFSTPISLTRFKVLSAPWEETSGANISNGTVMKDCGIIPRALTALEMQQLTRLL